MPKKKIALIGNPNTGKTALFNILTKSKQRIGNWPGVTIEKKSGFFNVKDQSFELIDLPGVYSILENDDHISDDEKVTNDFLLNGEYDFVINIISATDLERGLNISCKLKEAKIPFIVALNMTDLAKKYKIDINKDVLGMELDTSVTNINAKYKKGIPELLTEIANFSSKESLNENTFKCPHGCCGCNMNNIKNIVSTVSNEAEFSAETSDKIDKVILNPFLGFPIFLIVMYALFSLSITVGSALSVMATDLFDNLFEIINNSANLPEILNVLLIRGLGEGLKTVVSFIPIIGILFLLLSFLENSGYMSRVAFIMDGFMKKLGLSGKSIFPLITGFGCSVPSIMSTRILSSKREKIINIMVIPFISCGAKLPVYSMLAYMFFKEHAGGIVFLIYLIGILVGILTALIMKNFNFAKTPCNNCFLIDLPIYNIPKTRDLIIYAWNNTKIFIVGAGKLIIPMVIILSLINSLGTDLSIGNDNTDKSILVNISKFIAPVFEPMGIAKDHWQSVVAIFMGIFAKEAIVGTLNSLYEDVATSFENKRAVFSYLIFILLYSPCLAALGTIYKELNMRWAAFITIYSTVIAYVLAVAFYQISSFMVIN